MTRLDHAYRHLMLAVSGDSRAELLVLASRSADDRVPSASLVNDLHQVLTGPTELGRSMRLASIVLGPIPSDPATTRIADPFILWLRDDAAA